MNQRILLGLSLPLILIAALGAWWFLGRGGGPLDEGGASALVAEPDGAAAPADAASAPAPDEPAAPQSEQRSGIAEDDDAAELRAQVLAEGFAVPVRVGLPAGVPSDERIEVNAISFPRSLYKTDEGAREAARRWEMRRERSGFVFNAEIVESGPEPGVRVACEPDGRGGWIARFAQDAPIGFVSFEARYCYVSKPAKVALPSNLVELEAKLGAWLAGRVVLPAALPGDFDAEQLAAVKVQLMGWSMGDGANHSTHTAVAPDLSFSLGGLRPGMNYFLAIDPLVFVPVSDAEINANAGERLERSYSLQLGARVSGIVRLPDGRPAEGAAVQAEGGDGNWFMGRSGRSQTVGSDGAFDLRGVAAGQRDVNATLEGFVAARSGELELAEGQRLDGLELRLGEGRTVSGVVLWPDRTPAVGAAVSISEARSDEGGRGRGRNAAAQRAMRRFQGWTGREVRTDELGRFSRSGIDAERVTVFAAAEKPIEGFPASWTAGAEGVEASAGIEIVLREPLPIRGRVLDSAGQPLPEFEVTTSVAEERNSGSEDQAFENRADGTFTVYVTPGSYDVLAKARGFTPSEPQRAQVPPGGEELVFRLARASLIHGVVLAPTGQPVPGARVTHSEAGGNRMFGGGGGLNAECDAEGRFTLEEVPPGAALLSARAEAWARSADVEITVEPGIDIEGLRLVLRVGGRLEGEIYDSTGKPDPDRQIMIGNFGPGGGDMGGTTKSDAGGRFTAERLAPGKYNVMAMPRMNALREDADDPTAMLSQLKMTPVEIVDGQTAHVVLGAPPKNPVRVSGRVLQGERAMASGMVMAFAEGSSMLSSMKAGKIAPDGSYTLTLDAPGDYSFIVGQQMGDDDSTEFHETIPEVPEHTLDLELPSGGIRGRIVGPDGAPAANVALSVEREGRASLFAFDMGRNQSSDEDGRFELSNLREGRYTLRAGNTGMGAFFGGAPRYGTAIVTGLAVAKNKFLEGIEIRLDAPCVLSGVVRGPDGKPAPGAAVFVRDASGRVVNPMSSCMTDGEGRFTFEGAAPGSYTLSARKEQLASRESGAVRAAPGPAATVELTLEGGTLLKVSVEDGEGRTLRASIRVVDEAGREYSGLLSADAFQQIFTEGFSSTETKIGPLPPGKYRVIATDDAGKSETKPLTLSGQPERSMRVRLD